jgi:hypothetical protein
MKHARSKRLMKVTKAFMVHDVKDCVYMSYMCTSQPLTLKQISCNIFTHITHTNISQYFRMILHYDVEMCMESFIFTKIRNSAAQTKTEEVVTTLKLNAFQSILLLSIEQSANKLLQAILITT